MAMSILSAIPNDVKSAYFDGHPANAAVLSRDEVDALLEIAFLAAFTDGHVSKEEDRAFAELLMHFTGTVADRNARYNAGMVHAHRTQVDERLQALGVVLASPAAKELAYKITFALSMVDLASSAEEARFDRALVAALGLSEEDETRLTEEVIGALGA